MTTAYWIDHRGKILNIGSGTHIEQITRHPQKFGISKEAIQSIYKKYNEPMNSEGKAREDIIKQVIRKGFIRIRLYTNKYWSVTVNKLGRREKKALGEWSYEAKKDRTSGPYMPVRILDLETDSLDTSYEVGELGKLQYEDVENYKPEFVTIDNFGFPVLKSFKTFL